MKFNLCEILLVDDDEIDRMSVSRTLRKLNILNKVHEAANGEEAIDIVKTLPKGAIVLLDLNMPRMGGLEFLEKTRSLMQDKNLIIVVLTSSSNANDIEKSYKYNIAGYLTKPLDSADLMTKMAAFGKYWQLCELP